MKRILFWVTVFLAPHVASAQVCPNVTFGPGNTPGDFTQFICFFIDIIDSLIPLFGALAFLAFIWGIIKFINAAGDEKKTSDSKEIMFWGVIALFVLFTVFGILQLVSSIFFGGTPIGVPLLPGTTPSSP